MDRFNKELDQLKNSSGGIKPNLHILDEIVPIEEQMKYFQYSKYVHADKNQVSLDRNYLITKLFTPNVELEDKRYYLTMLAGIVDVAAYRAIEAYHKNPLEPELTYWSALAMIESKVLLDADLSGERQYFVSTGLGGQGGMLRFFCVVASSDFLAFTSFQKEVLRQELLFVFGKANIIVEEMNDNENYFTIILLSNINNDLRKMITDVIAEVNLLGNFINDKFILTNMKKITDEDIETALHKSE